MGRESAKVALSVVDDAGIIAKEMEPSVGLTGAEPEAMSLGAESETTTLAFRRESAT